MIEEIGMRYIGLLIVLLSIAVGAIAADSGSVQPTDTANLTPVLKMGDVSKYNVKVKVVGNIRLPGSEQPVPIDVVLDLLLSHSIGQSSKDGATPISVKAESASVSMGGQQMELSKGTFPDMTILLGEDGEMKVFSSDSAGFKLPGINYRNLILLFRTFAPQGDLKPGLTWKKTVTLNPDPDKYNMSFSFDSFEDFKGVKTAVVKSNVEILSAAMPGYQAKGFAQTNYSLKGAGLVKSHAEMTLGDSSKSDSKDSVKEECKVTVDIIRADLANSSEKAK